MNQSFLQNFTYILYIYSLVNICQIKSNQFNLLVFLNNPLNEAADNSHLFVNRITLIVLFVFDSREWAD